MRFRGILILFKYQFGCIPAAANVNAHKVYAAEMAQSAECRRVSPLRRNRKRFIHAPAHRISQMDLHNGTRISKPEYGESAIMRWVWIQIAKRIIVFPYNHLLG